MVQGNDPLVPEHLTRSGDYSTAHSEYRGIDIRTELASRNLAAMLANPFFGSGFAQQRVDLAVKHADLLLEALNK